MPKIVGLMVVGPGEGDRWLSPVLEQRKKLVDDMVIVGNNTDKKTEKIIRGSGYWFYRDDREWGIHQPKIKTDLLARVAKLKPDWVLPSDADELYDKYFTREEAEKLTKGGAIAYNFYVVNLWNDEEHYRKHLSFLNVRFFKFINDPYALVYANKNVHCGLAPPIFYHEAKDAPFILKHYGLMKPEDRKKKAERYDKYDPKRIFKGGDFYDEILRETTGSPFNEDELHQKVAELVRLKK